MSNRTRSSRFAFRAVVVAAIVLVVATVAHAQQTPPLKLQRTVTLDNVGDANVHIELKLPTVLYTAAKQETPNVAVLLRRLGKGQHWAELEDVKGTFNDDTNTISIDYKHRGLARTVQDVLWELDFELEADVDLVGTFGNVAIFTTAQATDFGVANYVIRVEVPPSASQLEAQSGYKKITYRLEPSAEGEGEVRADFNWQAKPKVMSCLAKSYGNDRFTFMWIARSIFKNTGERTLHNYRVRYRISGFSDWSSWMTSKRVVPGQTVVDPFFPVFDLEKLAAMEGARPASIELEYEYEDHEGRLIKESDSRRVELLGRNQVIFSTLDNSEVTSWHDAFDYGPPVLASFVSCSDPVMQQLAGRISGMAGGAAASMNDEEAVKFMKATYDFMSTSGIAYQTPPGIKVQGQFGQHIKYGRDVLRNRAGTCIDLAILYGSVCESVGLKPVLYLVPGHCFPAVELPSGELLPVEATMIGNGDFAAAVERGVQNVREAANSGRFYRVDVQQLHEMGVHSLDLPPVEPDYLQKLNYSFDVPSSTTSEATQVEESTSGTTSSNLNAQVAGKWIYQGEIEGASFVCVSILTEDGRYGSYVKISNAAGYFQELEENGTFAVNGNYIVFTPDDGSGSVGRQFERRSTTLFVWMAELKTWLGFKPVE